MAFTGDCPQGRSQHLTFTESSDKIVIDRETFHRLHLLVNHCMDELINPLYYEIFLASLKVYLTETDNPQSVKALLLLDSYYNVVPDSFSEMARWLKEATEIFSVISAASKLGGGNG